MHIPSERDSLFPPYGWHQTRQQEQIRKHIKIQMKELSKIKQ